MPASLQESIEYGRTDDNSRPGVLFQPDWDKQVHLCVVPCKGSVACHWRRQTICSTLGDMFKALGTHHSASEIYYFYKTRKIVARKMRR